tara:strand:- start:133 stop:336 length:204 start_codon:yes stop_codon:yes gene_type:complete
MSVNIESLKELSNSMPFKVSNDERIMSDKIKINIVKKYLLISLKSKFIFVNINLFVNMFFGLLKDKI